VGAPHRRARPPLHTRSGHHLRLRRAGEEVAAAVGR
jgi:hypothetical protein